MQRKIRTMLLMSFITAFLSLAISSTATGQAIDFVATSQPIRVVSSNDCETQLRTALERLDKTLDAFEKSQKALGFAMDEIEARQRLDALKDQIIAVKDIIIANQDELIKRLQKNKTGFLSRLKSILKTAEKIALLGIGVYIGGRGL